jgi:hypothetical protein
MMLTSWAAPAEAEARRGAELVEGPRAPESAADPRAAETPESLEAVTRSSAGCDVMWTLEVLDKRQRAALYTACARGVSSADSRLLETAASRLSSSTGWHAGALEHLLARAGPASSLTVGAGASSLVSLQELVQREQRAFAALPELAEEQSTGLERACRKIRHGPLMQEFLEDLDQGAETLTLPFGRRFVECLGASPESLRGSRFLLVRADGLSTMSAVIGTQAYTHIRRYESADTIEFGGHRFLVLIVPVTAKVTLVGHHENLELPLYWRGIIGRNEVVWAEPGPWSCLEVSIVVSEDVDTKLFVDGVLFAAPGSATQGSALRHEHTLTIAVDRVDARAPVHEIVALRRSEDKDAVTAWDIRHQEALPRIAAGSLRRGECRSLSLDFSEPTKKRIAVLGVTQSPSCELSPMWTDSLRERVRRILKDDPVHRDVREYANFAAYTTAATALSTLKSKLNPTEGATTGGQTGADALELVGTAAKEAWRQGIDTLLSFELQCTPIDLAEERWSYSLKATKIEVRELFNRGYHGRESLDLEDFIHVNAIGFDASPIQESLLAVLLDRVFEISGMRFIFESAPVRYRTTQTVRVGVLFPRPGLTEAPARREEAEAGAGAELEAPTNQTAGPMKMTANSVDLHILPLDRHEGVEWSDGAIERNAALWLRGKAKRRRRPAVCDRLEGQEVGVLDRVASLYDGAGTSRRWRGRRSSLTRSRRALDQTSNPSAAVYEGVFVAPRPGWYLLALENRQGDMVVDAVCVHATVERNEIWGDLGVTGGPLMRAFNKALGETGTAADFYLHARVGTTWYPAPRASWFGVGLFGGFAFTNYSGVRADWSDLGGTGGQTGMPWPPG